MGKRKNKGKSLTISRPSTQKYIGENINSIVVNKLEVRPIVRQSQDIQRWRSAQLMAEGIGQQRALLYDIYSDVLLDGYLAEGLIGKRRKSITNKTIAFMDKNGKKIEDISALTEKTPFESLLTHIIDARFWGYSLIELDWTKEDDIRNKTTLIPRKHVKPRHKIVVRSEWDSDGYAYNEPPLSETAIAVGDEEDLGILNMIAPLVLWKRANMGDWAEFIETFGMPTVFAKYNNEQSRKVLIDALDKMGSRGRAVMPNDASLEYHDTTGNNKGDVFNDFRSALNEEMSVTVLGNTMTTSEAKSSGYAQSVTHERSQAEIHKDDCKFVLRVLNEQLIPFLVNIGYSECAGGKWQFADEETMSLTERLEIDLKVSEKVTIPEDYWYEKYKIPRPTDAEKKKPNPTTRLKLSDIYAQECPSCDNLGHLNLSNPMPLIPNVEIDAYLKRVFDGKVKSIDANMWELTFDVLKKGLSEGLSESLNLSVLPIETRYGEDWRFNQEVLKNTAVFAAFKNHENSEALARNLLKEDGTLKSFQAFAKDAAKITQDSTYKYLQAEYQTCIASARMAVKWRNFERRADLYPNLKYITIGDARVRPEHKILDGIIQPINSDFYKTHLPPNGWRCRCSVLQTDAKPTDDGTNGFFPKPPFDGNVGLSAKPFSENHPYFDVKPKVLLQITTQAEQLLSQKTKEEVLEFAKKEKFPPAILPDTKEKVVISYKTFEKLVNQPISKPYIRNNLLLVLWDALMNLTAVEDAQEASKKALERYAQIERIYRLKLHYANLQESYDFKFVSADGATQLDSITDSK